MIREQFSALKRCSTQNLIPTRTYFETDIEEGATPVDADCEVVVRTPVLASIDSAEMDIAL